MRYSDLVDVYKKLESTSKRLEKTHIISEIIKASSSSDLPKIVLMLQGKVFPNWDEKKIGVASRLVVKAINVATGINSRNIEKEWKKTGDLGIVAENLTSVKKQRTLLSQELDVAKVFSNLRKLAEMVGTGTVDKKIQLIAELMTSANPSEAKYIVRTILEELRVGVGEGSLRDAIIWANFSEKLGIKYNRDENDIELDEEKRKEYNNYVEIIQRAYDLTNDFSSVAEITKEKGLDGLKKVDLIVGIPIKVMLAIKVDNIEEGFERVGTPAQIEYKYDGFRMQVHKKENKIWIFTRRLEHVTEQFPDVVKVIKEHVKGDSFIIDCEAVGYDSKSKRYLPFQNISQRIKRKYYIDDIAKKFPVELDVFDVIYYNGESMINNPFEKRRALLEKIIKPKELKIVLAKGIVSGEKKKCEEFYNESVKAGNEGVMMKKLDAPYKPGSRVGYMVKLKTEKESLDVVVTEAEWGEGKRTNWLSSFTIACIDENNNFIEIGKVSTGLKEKEEDSEGSFKQITEILKPLIIAEKGRKVKVKPEIVIEVSYEEVQKSPTYESGFALRFPRFKRLRYIERRPEEIVTLKEIEDLYFEQKKRG